MRQCLLAYCLLLLSWMLAASDEKTNACYYAPDGSLNCLTQLFGEAAVPHGALSAPLYRDIRFGPVTATAETLNILKLQYAQPDFRSWKKLQEGLAVEGIEIWPVVSYGAGKPFALNGQLGLAFRHGVPLKVRHELFEKLAVTIIENPADDPDYYLVKLRPGSDPFALARTIFATGLAVWAQPNWYFTPVSFATANDTYFTDQWHLSEASDLADINAPGAWDTTTGSAAIKVAVIDSGVQLNHPDLSANIDTLAPVTDYYYDYLDGDNDPSAKLIGNGYDAHAGYAHGTACSGIIAAVSNNNKGMAGICQNCKIIPIRLVGDYPVTADAQLKALKLAVLRGAAVINNSYGIPMSDDSGNCVGLPFDGYRSQGVAYAKESGRGGKGTIVVWASGNDACSTANDPGFSDDSIVVVSAMKENGSFASYSNYGSEIDVVAPAAAYTIDITGTPGMNSSVSNDSLPTDYTSQFAGTSAAAPVTAGAIALMLSANPALTFDQAMSCIKNNAKKLPSRSCSHGSWSALSDPYVSGGSASHSPCFGFGLIDAEALVTAAADGLCGAGGTECTKYADYDLCYDTGIGKDDDCNDSIDDLCDTGGKGKAGDACTKAANCQNSGKTPLCRTDMPSGYCSSDCSVDTDCYGNAYCSAGKCYALCNAETVLRSGYACSFGLIVEKCTKNSECGTGKTCETSTGLCTTNGCGAPGAACSKDTDCMGYGACIKGSCVSDCTVKAECPGDALCVSAAGAPAHKICIDTCKDTENCAAGNVCKDTTEGGLCMPKCTSKTDCGGKSCNTGTGLCEGEKEKQSSNPPEEEDFDGDWCGADDTPAADTDRPKADKDTVLIPDDSDELLADTTEPADETAPFDDVPVTPPDYDIKRYNKTGSGCSVVSF